nr:hypothetical protein [Tanacetum cinerariifolium]
MRIPLLYRGEYSQRSERFMNYLEEKMDEEAMINCIKHGDQPLPRVTQVSITGTSSTEQPSLKNKSMCNKTAKDLWDALARYMFGSEYALIVERTKFANKKQEYVKSDDKKVEKKDDEKKQDMSKVKCYNCKKECHFAKYCKKAKVKDYEYYKTKMLLAKKDKDQQVLLAEDHAWMESSSDSDQEINANMVFMAQIKKGLSDSEASSSSVDDKISEVSYYLSESESESEYETLEYYDNTTTYGLFVNDNVDQEFFHDCENFLENLIESQIDHNDSVVDHNDSEEVNKLIRKFNKKIAKCLKRIDKANQQNKDFENPNKDLQDKYDVLKNQATTFEMQNNELNEQIKVLIEKNDDLLAQMNMLKDQLQVKHVVIDTHVESLEIEKFKRARENKIELAYDYGNLNASYVNEKINLSDDYFQKIINLDFDKIDSPFQQTSSLEPYVPNLILEKIIIDLEDEVGSSNTIKADLSSVNHSNLNKNVKRYSRKNLMACNNSDTRCNNARNALCNARMNASIDVNDLFIFDDIVQIYLWIIDSGCPKHMTGNRALLTNFVEKFLGTVLFGNNDFAVIAGYGDVVIGSMTIKKVYYVEGLPKMKFEKDHLCSVCEQGKIHQKHHKSKTVFASNQPLSLLHMDLCGPMRVESINGKRYVLVVVDDYSWYTWVFFLHLKDEAFEVIISFIKKTQVNLQLQVQRVRTDNGTEFKNKTIAKFFDERVRTDNGTKFKNKTLAKFIDERKPNIKFFHVFGCRCYLLNDYDDVGKLKEKWDIEVFVGYSKESASFRVYNKQTRKIHESVNVNFDELLEMASMQFSLEPGLSNLNKTGKSSNPPVSQVSETSKKDLEDLFQNFYDEYFDSSKIMKSSTTNVETSNVKIPSNEEVVFHKSSESFQEESSSSFLNDDVHQSLAEVAVPSSNTQLFSKKMVPNVDEASTSHNVFNEHLENAYFDAITLFHDPFNVHTFYQPYPHEKKWTKDHPLHKII